MKLLVNFMRGEGEKPVIAQVVKETGVLISVERAYIDSSEGEVLIDLPDDQCGLVSEKMRNYGAKVRILDEGIRIDRNECVDCGACISICPKEVFSFDAEWQLVVDESKCILCGKCVDACPHNALSVFK